MHRGARTKTISIGALIAALTLLAGCGSSGSGSTSSTTSAASATSTSSTESTTTATTARACGSCCSSRAARFAVTYCHNPDTWHLKDGTYVSAQQVIDRLAGFAPALRTLDGGLTISGGEPMVQLSFTRRILAAAKPMGLHTAIETSGFLGDRVDESFLAELDLVLLDIKSSDPGHLSQGNRPRVAPTLRFAERLATIGKPVWVRFTLVAGLTDDPANVDGIAKFVAPMKNVEWVEVQPFHQLGEFKWKALNLDYKLANTGLRPPISSLA